LKNTLIIGGARSGKSRIAQEIALLTGQPVLFVATAMAGDEEMRRRIEEHKRTRPEDWVTLEATTQVGRQITGKIDDIRTVLLDCVTLLVSNVLLNCIDRAGGEIDTVKIEKEVMAEIEELVQCIDSVEADFIIVTNEVGLDLVPVNKIGRLYRDLLGRANQVLAARVEEVYLMVAGVPMLIKPAVSRPA